MKQKKTNLLILLSAIICLNIPAFSQDLSVFDLKLNEPFNIPECRYEIVEMKLLGNGGLFSRSKKARVYQYVEERPATGKCFRRVDLSDWLVPDKNNPATQNHPTLKPIINEYLLLVYADSSKPAITDKKDDIWIGIQDSKLTGIKFYFQNVKANEVFKTLDKKYGKPVSVEDFTIQNGIGGRKDFYKAEWEFSKLKVVFLSLDTNRIGYYPPPNDMNIGYSSNIGSVTIVYKTAGGKVKDANPL